MLCCLHDCCEIGGDYDIDVVVLVEKANNKKDIETFIRKDLSGITIGGLVLEPKDIESVADVSDYFKSRGIFYTSLLIDHESLKLNADITQNEILLFRYCAPLLTSSELLLILLEIPRNA